jgi:hypothetical protein
MAHLEEQYSLFSLSAAVGVMNLFALQNMAETQGQPILQPGGEGEKLVPVLVRANQAMTMPFIENFACLRYFGVSLNKLMSGLQETDASADKISAKLIKWDQEHFMGLKNGDCVREVKAMVVAYSTKMHVGEWVDGKTDKEVLMICAVYMKRMALGLLLYFPNDKQITLIEYIFSPRVMYTTKRWCSGLHLLHSIAVFDCQELFSADGDEVFDRQSSYDLIQRVFLRVVRDGFHLMLMHRVRELQRKKSGLPALPGAIVSNKDDGILVCLCSFVVWMFLVIFMFSLR